MRIIHVIEGNMEYRYDESESHLISNENGVVIGSVRHIDGGFFAACKIDTLSQAFDRRALAVVTWRKISEESK